MDETTDWQDEKFAQVFDGELRMLARRFAHDPASSLEDVEMQLKGMYHNQGNDWEGRGPLSDIVLAATVAAYEEFLHRKR
jgi:hypothetical protein